MRNRTESVVLISAGGLFILTVLLRRLCRPSLSVSSLTPMAFGRSCLLANTRSTASFSSSSWTCTESCDIQSVVSMTIMSLMMRNCKVNKGTDHLRELLRRLSDSLPVITVHHEDQTLWSIHQSSIQLIHQYSD